MQDQGEAQDEVHLCELAMGHNLQNTEVEGRRHTRD